MARPVELKDARQECIILDEESREIVRRREGSYKSRSELIRCALVSYDKTTAADLVENLRAVIRKQEALLLEKEEKIQLLEDNIKQLKQARSEHKKTDGVDRTALDPKMAVTIPSLEEIVTKRRREYIKLPWVREHIVQLKKEIKGEVDKENGTDPNAIGASERTKNTKKHLRFGTWAEFQAYIDSADISLPLNPNGSC